MISFERITADEKLGLREVRLKEQGVYFIIDETDRNRAVLVSASGDVIGEVTRHYTDRKES